jgi:hypothetical protein
MTATSAWWRAEECMTGFLCIDEGVLGSPPVLGTGGDVTVR